MPKVFLGGTCNDSKWRSELVQNLKIDYFNPVVEDWTEEDMKNEIIQRQTCDFVLYVITPLIAGVYSIAEVIDDSNKRPEKTIFCFIQKDFDKDKRIRIFSEDQIKSLNQVGKMVEENGGKWFKTIDEVREYLNKSDNTWFN